MISKSCVITAVDESIAVAEQYFSWLRLIACSTSCGRRFLPRTTKCRWMLVNTLGSFYARSAFSVTSQPVIGWPLFFRINTTS